MIPSDSFALISFEISLMIKFSFFNLGSSCKDLIVFGLYPPLPIIINVAPYRIQYSLKLLLGSSYNAHTPSPSLPSYSLKK